MTECTQGSLRFRSPSGHEIVADFDGGDITSDAGSLLLRAVDDRARVISRFAGCFTDHRDPGRIEHTVEEMARQRVFGLALGYEDLVDHDDLRRDPLLASVIGKRDPKGASRRDRDQGNGLAGSRTLNRLELSTPDAAATDRYRRIALDPESVDDLLVDLFLEAYKHAPRRIVLDLDATDDPLHGRQEGRFFHGYYDCYCYLPLYIFAGEHLLCARLRRSNIDAAAGSVEELQRIVSRIRARWPKVKVVIRGDSGFCRDRLMNWCEKEKVDYVLGLARNSRLEDQVAPLLGLAKDRFESCGKATRLYGTFKWRTLDSWSRARRVIAKGEHNALGANPRFIVTSLPCRTAKEAKRLYKKVYCARGDMENRIKEQQLYLFADRTSAHTMRANQVRLYMSSMAYVLLSAIRRTALLGTTMANAQCSTIRLRLLKIGARIRVTARRVWVHMASSCPSANLFVLVMGRLKPT
jgi:Transposase DDE domain group 1